MTFTDALIFVLGLSLGGFGATLTFIVAGVV